jgi:ATP-binding cassette subfamily C (CFTR/MRP) protein 1
LIASITLVPLSQLEHARSTRPSSPVILYLLSSFCLDLPQLRTLFLREETSGIAIVFLFVLFIKLVFLLLELQSKNAFLKQELCKLPPESTSSVLNRVFLWWLNDLFVLGSKGIITSGALPALDEELLSETLGDNMQKAWSRRGTLSFYPETFNSLHELCTTLRHLG